jgi:hypothetical protein
MKFLSMCKTVALTVLLSIAALPAMAQSLSTTYAGGNSFAGNTFDITPNKNIQINGFDIHISGSAEFATIAIYWRNGTANGFQDSAAGWTLLGTTNVAPQGFGVPTHVSIGGLSMTAGQTYGIYLDVQNHGGFGTGDFLSLNYTNGGPSDYSNADLVLTTFHGKGAPAFTGPSFFPRQWNGTVYYTLTQTCASEGYTGTKLEWCKNICERGYTGGTLAMWIRRWTDRYRTLPYCALAPQPVPTAR